MHSKEFPFPVGIRVDNDLEKLWHTFSTPAGAKPVRSETLQSTSRALSEKIQ